MRMEHLDSSDSIGAGTNGSGGILISVWDRPYAHFQSSARAFLTVREAEWLVEKLQEVIQTAREEINGKCFVTRNPEIGQ